MLFSARFWPGIADGSIQVAYRRQKRPTVKAGGRLRSPGGYLAIDSVDAVDEATVTDADARAAGHVDRAELFKMLKPDGTLYRIRFHLAGDDPRDALRTDENIADVAAKVTRLEWALPILRLIRDNEGVVSTELAPQVGMERMPFKQRVTRLKELGLTISLQTGYRLSPRGAALLRELDAHPK
jgi:hypothetical protein